MSDSPSTEYVERMSYVDVQKLLHEVHVHQIELEMQNEELRQTVLDLDASRRAYQSLYDLAPVGYFTVDETGLIQQANLTAATLLGVPRNLLIKQALSSFIAREDQDIYYQLRRQSVVSAGSHVCELQMLKSDRTIFWGRLEAVVLSDESSALSIVLSEVTERKLAEQSLYESELFKRAILDAIPSQIAVLDCNGFIVEVNAPWQRFALDNSATAGTAAKHTQIGVNYLAICQSSLREGDESAREVYHGIRQVLDGQRSTFSREYPCHSPSEQRWFEMVVSPLATDRHSVVVVHSNITERKQMLAALQASESKYRALMEHAAEAVVIADMEGTVLEINAKAMALLGYERNDLIGENISLIHPADEMPMIAEDFRKFEREARVETSRCHVLTRQGRCVPVKIAAMAVMVAGCKVAMGIFHDLSEQQQREEQRLRAESVHRDILVREVHHRVKNSLQGVTGLLREAASRQPELALAISEVISQVSSIARVYGLYGSQSGGQVSLCDLVADIARNAETLWPMKISMEVKGAPRLGNIKENEAVPLALVLNELLANACKHGDRVSGNCHVSIEITTDRVQARVSITNAGHLPPGFDFERRQGLGTGLELVALLMARGEGSLEWTQQQNTVVTQLSLLASFFAEETFAGGVST